MISSEELIAALPQVRLYRWRHMAFHSVVCDSRLVETGDLFVAIPGVSVDGHEYVGAALRAGASACVVERSLPELGEVPTAIVPDARQALAYLHAALHGYPARALKVIGVTGTDGKTTTVRLITGILEAAGKATGRIDSVSATLGGQEVATGFHTTTPDAPEVQAYLAQMVASDLEYAVLESTSHGLAQHRVAACEYDIAVVTNITHEHLDFHGSYEAYRGAKAMLFEALTTSVRKPGVEKVAVLNAEDSSFDYLRHIPADRQITYGRASGDVRAKDLRFSPSGVRFSLVTPDYRLAIASPLVGAYNALNILAAASVGYALGLEHEAIRAGVAGVRGVVGRMERIDRGQPYTVIVDFAHTPNALQSVLTAVRDLTKGKVVVVFGCAGLRDRAKRPWMGEIAARLADRVVITAEDPRTESLDDIMEEIAVGCRKAGRSEGEGFYRVADRGEAIDRALELVGPGDLVVVTGKGHEQSMCFGTTEYPWSDHQAILESLMKQGYDA